MGLSKPAFCISAFFILVFLPGCDLLSFTWQVYEGKQAEAVGDYREAVQHYGRAIEKFPNNAESYILRAGVFSLMGDYDSAIADIDHALEISPNQAIYHFNRGNAQMGRQRNDLAIADYSRSLELDANRMDALRRRGLALFLENRYDEARADFLRLLKWNPDDDYSPLWLYLIAARSGAPDNTLLDEPLKAGKVKPWPAALYQLFLETLDFKSLAEDARKKRFQDDYSIAERETEAHFYIGQYHLIRGEKQAAKQAFLKAAERKSIGIFEALASKTELNRLN